MDVIMNTLIPNEVGLWIECCYPGCKKWRFSLDFDDPLAVPKEWYCHMNSDQSLNDCSIPECLDLEKGEIFVESRFKAGCIVWAKVLGYPWSVAMVDFCPEFECYYWFDDITTNVPSQYHVTFLGGKNVTRAWVKSSYLKSFIENSNPAFALKSRVHGKKLSARQQTDILERCEIAHTASSLSIERRLKKYNFNSWRLVQCHRRGFQNSGRKARAPLLDAQTNNDKNPKIVAGPSSIKKSLRQTKTKVGNEIDRERPLSKEQPSCSVLANHKDSKSHSVLSVETQNSNVHGSDDSTVLDDTRSISSSILKDSTETRANKERFESSEIPESQSINLKLDDESGVNEVNHEKLPDEENQTIEILSDNPDEIVPSSQPTTPRKDSFSKILWRNLSVERDNNYNRKDKSAKNTLSLENSISGSKLSQKSKYMNKERRRRFDNSKVNKSTSGNLLSSSENKENYFEKSGYLRALSEFTQRSKDNSFSSASNENMNNGLYQNKRIINPRKTLPSWYTNPEERRIIQSQRLARLSKLSDEEDRKMFEENRRSFIEGIESAAPIIAGPSKGGKNRYAEAQPALNNYMQMQNTDHLLTSDEDSS